MGFMGVVREDAPDTGWRQKIAGLTIPHVPVLYHIKHLDDILVSEPAANSSKERINTYTYTVLGETPKLKKSIIYHTHKVVLGYGNNPESDRKNTLYASFHSEGIRHGGISLAVAFESRIFGENGDRNVKLTSEKNRYNTTFKLHCPNSPGCLEIKSTGYALDYEKKILYMKLDPPSDGTGHVLKIYFNSNLVPSLDSVGVNAFDRAFPTDKLFWGLSAELKKGKIWSYGTFDH
jgi:hypothetical protein